MGSGDSSIRRSALRTSLAKLTRPTKYPRNSADPVASSTDHTGAASSQGVSSSYLSLVAGVVIWNPWVREPISESERHDLIVGQLVGLADQVVAWAQARDQPRLLVERALARQHANRHSAARAVVGQSGI